MHQKSSHDRGFSLVEITLAIGIAAVALVTAIGLLGAAFDANGAAGRDTAIVTMTTQVMNDLRSTPSFDALWEETPRKAGNNGFVLKPTTVSNLTPKPTSYFFDQNGNLITGSAPANDPNTIYECKVTKTPAMPDPKENRGPSNLLKLRLEFTSPVSANPGNPAKRPNRQTIHASIARF